MRILAIDTSTDYLSIAILKDGSIAGRFHKMSAMRHSSMLVPMIDRLLKKAETKIDDIDCFVISAGPGSFTGLRIGVTTIKAMAYALKKPVVAIPTLDIIAANIKNFTGIICPVLDARKGKVYSAIYKSDGKNTRRISKYLLLPAADLLKKVSRYDNIIFTGDAVDLGPSAAPIRRGFRIKFASQIWHPRAEIAARMAIEHMKKKKFTTPEDLEPLYLYSKECDITGK